MYLAHPHAGAADEATVLVFAAMLAVAILIACIYVSRQ